MSGTDIVKHPIHLGRGATAVVEPAFTGDMAWYQGYTSRHADDGKEGRLVSMFTFTESWGMWEMHPTGSEVVLCTSGTLNAASGESRRISAQGPVAARRVRHQRARHLAHRRRRWRGHRGLHHGWFGHATPPSLRAAGPPTASRGRSAAGDWRSSSVSLGCEPRSDGD